MKEFIPEDTFEETDNKNELRNLLFNYFIYWKWFILSVVLCWAGAWFYLRYATPVYNVSATVMIKDDKKGSRANEILALEDMGFLSSSGSIENEMGDPPLKISHQTGGDRFEDICHLYHQRTYRITGSLYGQPHSR